MACYVSKVAADSDK